MQTHLTDAIKETKEGQEAEAILRQCVHCGMCNATCPTYQLLGDELDGPRGRIYLIKQVLEGHQPTKKTQTHLDRCLTCRSCETTCPSGVQYGRLLDIGREIVERKVGRPWSQSLLRSALKRGLTNPGLFRYALTVGRKVRPLLSATLQKKIPPQAQASIWPQEIYPRKMLLLDGCVQPTLAPNINAATARVLARVGVQVLLAPKAGCCGAVSLHLNDHHASLDFARANIDAWWPFIETKSEKNSEQNTDREKVVNLVNGTAQEIEAIVITASGCGVMVKDYGDLLAHDSKYAEKAKRISALTRDVSEILPEFGNQLLAKTGGKIAKTIAWHPPCTLQHGQKIHGKVEQLLRDLGVDVRLCADSHICCGSAGTYSILQSKIALQLRDNKIAALESCQAELILSANMACQQHLQSGTKTPITHWVELIDEVLSEQVHVAASEE
jgi:glycolate oxidase iron-sulfur subunit